MMDYDIRHGRTYLYFAGEPQYAFGHGLSDTTFAHADLRTSTPTLSPGAAVDVTNTGSRAGDEVVQLYARHPESKAPLEQLRGFQRVGLAPGETKTGTLRLRAFDLAYWDTEQGTWTVDPGPVEVLVGRSSADADVTLRRTVIVKASP